MLSIFSHGMPGKMKNLSHLQKLFQNYEHPPHRYRKDTEPLYHSLCTQLYHFFRVSIHSLQNILVTSFSVFHSEATVIIWGIVETNKEA